MKPRIAIGITTYKDITSTDIGLAVFDAYSTASDRITPDQTSVRGVKSPVTDRLEFARNWSTELPYEVRENRSRNAAVLDRGSYLVGAEWKRGGALPGRGSVRFRPALDPSRTSEILITHAYSPRIDWLTLFKALAAATQPAYAMMHVFTDHELERSSFGDRFEVFDGPFAGEKWFTHFRSPLGHWDGPDTLRLKERRNYRFLPELSWANLLGAEFDGNYDPQILNTKAAWTETTGYATLFCITASLQDVIDRYDAFNLARVQVRGAFPPRAFHRANIAAVVE